MREQILGLTTPLMALVFAALFLALWWRVKTGRHMLAFAGGYLLFATGFVVTHFLPTEIAATFYVTQAFYTGASALLIWGACNRAGVKPFMGVHAVIYLTAFGALSLAVAMGSDAGPRLIIVNTGYGAMFLVTFMALIGAPRRSIMDTAILVVLAVHSADFFVRPMITSLAEGAIPLGDYRQSIYYSIINIVLMVKTLNTAIVLVGASIYDIFHAERARSNRDGLTGLRNRRAFEAAIANPLTRAEFTEEPLCLVVADIDHFKQVNDLWGHQAGDQAIAAFAQLLEEMIREDDISGRIGGEEFALLVRDCKEADAVRLADRIRKAFAQMVHPAIGDNLRLTCSFGVAHLRHGESYHRLFARADAALYKAKKSGRNMVETQTAKDSDIPAVEQAAAA